MRVLLPRIKSQGKEDMTGQMSLGTLDRLKMDFVMDKENMKVQWTVSSIKETGPLE